MKTSLVRRAMLAGAIATSGLVGITAATPAHAQLGGIVYDPTNYAQNVLTAARSLQQVNNQIQQIQNQATSLVNEARNLASLPFSSLQQLQQQVQRTQQLLGEAQRIPTKYLENILSELRRSGIVGSRRGSEGGYWLARPADQVSVADVIRAVEGPLADVRGEPPEEQDYIGPATPLDPDCQKKAK